MKLGNGDITFDNFVQACVTLSSLTKSFRSRDYETRGSIIINYEDVSKARVIVKWILKNMVDAETDTIVIINISSWHWS